MAVCLASIPGGSSSWWPAHACVPRKFTGTVGYMNVCVFHDRYYVSWVTSCSYQLVSRGCSWPAAPSPSCCPPPPEEGPARGVSFRAPLLLLVSFFCTCRRAPIRARRPVKYPILPLIRAARTADNARGRARAPCGALRAHSTRRDRSSAPSACARRCGCCARSTLTSTLPATPRTRAHVSCDARGPAARASASSARRGRRGRGVPRRRAPRRRRAAPTAANPTPVADPDRAAPAHAPGVVVPEPPDPAGAAARARRRVPTLRAVGLARRRRRSNVAQARGGSSPRPRRWTSARPPGHHVGGRGEDVGVSRGVARSGVVGGVAWVAWAPGARADGARPFFNFSSALTLRPPKRARRRRKRYPSAAAGGVAPKVGAPNFPWRRPRAMRRLNRVSRRLVPARCRAKCGAGAGPLGVGGVPRRMNVKHASSLEGRRCRSSLRYAQTTVFIIKSCSSHRAAGALCAPHPRSEAA